MINIFLYRPSFEWILFFIFPVCLFFRKGAIIFISILKKSQYPLIQLRIIFCLKLITDEFDICSNEPSVKFAYACLQKWEIVRVECYLEIIYISESSQSYFPLKLPDPNSSLPSVPSQRYYFIDELSMFLFVRQQKRQIDRMSKKQGMSSSGSSEGDGNMFDFLHKNGNIESQMEVLVHTFKQYSEQNKKLTGLYELTKLKNQELHRINGKFSRDLAFLKEYCLSLEHELGSLGYYKHQQGEMLSRKQTAEGIFVIYNQSTLSLNEECDFEDAQAEHRNRILNLQNENRLLKQQLQTQIHETLTKSTQATPADNQKQDIWRRAYEVSEERVTQLEKEVRELRRLNDTLEYERQRKGVANFIMKDRQKLFNNIHNLISEYKKKINDLAHEKKEVEKKYKQLKEKVSRLDENSEFKLIELYSEKIEVLQRLTEKQQVEIENTIELYEVELRKIEERRREEIEMFESERLDLETENLKLCIDLQKSLNNKDETTLQLMQEKNKNQILLEEIKQLREAIELYKKRQNLRKNLTLAKNNVEISINPDLIHSTHKNKLVSPSSSFVVNSNSEHSLTDNIEYQFSEVSDRRELIQKIEEISLKRENSLSKKPFRQKITITYGQPYLIKPHYGSNLITKPKNLITPKTIPSSPSSNVNKSYDSVIQYKKRFIERKPQSSFNQ